MSNNNINKLLTPTCYKLKAIREQHPTGDCYAKLCEIFTTQEQTALNELAEAYLNYYTKAFFLSKKERLLFQDTINKLFASWTRPTHKEFDNAITQLHENLYKSLTLHPLRVFLCLQTLRGYLDLRKSMNIIAYKVIALKNATLNVKVVKKRSKKA